MTKVLFKFLATFACVSMRQAVPLVLLLLGLNTTLVAAENNSTPQISESELRVAYVFNFTKFVTWPDDVNTDEFLTLCTYKVVQAQSVFAQLNDRVSGEQRVQVLNVQSPLDSNLNTCDFLYIGSEGESSKQEVLEAVSERPVLTISEQALQEPSVMVSLMIVDNKIAFEVDLLELRKKELAVSSYMLRLAMQVYE